MPHQQPGGRRRIVAERDASDYRVDRLTDRERVAFTLIGQGKSNGEFAGSLLFSPLTAQAHLRNIMTTLAARDRVQLVVIVDDTGFVVAGRRPAPLPS